MNPPVSGWGGGAGPGAADFPWRGTVAGGSLILIPSETSPPESPWTLTQTGISAVLTAGDMAYS